MSTKTAWTSILTTMHHGVLTLTLNRPHLRNALNAVMVDEITKVFLELDGREVRVIVIRGAGGNFCAGGDVKDMSALLEKQDLEEVVAYSASAGRMLQTVYQSKIAVIAACEGVVMGGGFGLSCVADVVIATEDARFGLPETSLGLVPAQIAPYVVKRVGRSYAKLLAVCGGSIDARKAQQIGLVHNIVPNSAVLDELIAEISQRVLGCAPGALSVSKQLVMAPEGLEPADPEQLGNIFARALLGGEAAEGIAAFAEKRKPQWVQ